MSTDTTPTPVILQPEEAARLGLPSTSAAHDVAALMARLNQRLALEASGPAIEPPPGYRTDAKGRLVPQKLIRPADDLEDSTARRIIAFGLDLADQISRFRRHSYADVASFLELLGDEYGVQRKPGRRGNFSLQSYDGLLKVVLQVQDRIVFGPELQVARKLVDTCIREWADGSRDEVVALLQGAFEPDREGNISREAIFRLRRIDIDDPRWRQVRRAIDDAVRVVGTKAYMRLYLRGSTDGPWRRCRSMTDAWGRCPGCGGLMGCADCDDRARAGGCPA